MSVWSEGNATQRRIVERMDWVRKIEYALDHDDMLLYAMPIVSLPMRSVERYELLIRLRDQHGNIVAPGAFLDTAERFDLIQQIDRWVATSAIAALHDGFGPASLAVNISGRSIGDTALLEMLRREAHTIPGGPGRLMFEVTETAAVGDLATARQFTERLRAAGYAVALDDFGAGFGSFAYLKHLEFDVLKIDGEFVRGCPGSPTDRLIIQAVVDIARGLGKRTVAEFTENEAIITCLTQLGVDMCQGYALGEPVPLEQVVSSLVVWSPAATAAPPGR